MSDQKPRSNGTTEDVTRMGKTFVTSKIKRTPHR